MLSVSVNIRFTNNKVGEETLGGVIQDYGIDCGDGVTSVYLSPTCQVVHVYEFKHSNHISQ